MFDSFSQLRVLNLTQVAGRPLSRLPHGPPWSTRVANRRGSRWATRTSVEAAGLGILGRDREEHRLRSVPTSRNSNRLKVDANAVLK